MLMFGKLRFAVAVALVFGSASTVLAASYGKDPHRAQRIERVTRPASERYDSISPLQEGACAADGGARVSIRVFA
jgi:hypothetical protein